MNIKWQYILFVLTCCAIILVLAFHVFSGHIIYFVLVELGVLFLLIYAYILYEDIQEPYQLVDQFKANLKEDDYTFQYARSGDGKKKELVDIFNRLILRLREERVYHTEEHFFLSELMEKAPVGIVILDYDGNLVEANPAAKALFQGDDDHSFERLKSFVQNLVSNPQERVIEMKNHRKLKVESGRFIHRGFERTFYMLDDLSEEWHAAEKQAFGKVIRMMAHEVNNSVGAINSILGTVEESMQAELSSEDRENLRGYLRMSMDRNHSLNHFMKNFASVVRLPQPVLEKQELYKVVHQSVQLFDRQLKESGITLELAPFEACCRFDKPLLEQVFINITKNAIEALDTRSADKTIKISWEPDTRRLRFSNNGDIILEEDRKELFKPFFSTKVTGQGIGLTIIREILDGHKIRYQLYSDDVGWTHFDMMFNKEV